VCNANLSLAELRLQTVESLGNSGYKSLKCLHDGHSISEHHLKTETILHVHGSVGNEGLCAIYLRADDNRTVHKGKASMLVRIGDVSELSRPVTSIERLQLLDSYGVYRANSSEISTFPLVLEIADSALKSLGRVLNRKLRSLYLLLRIEAGQLIDKIVESGSKVIDDLTNKNTESLRYGNRAPSDVADMSELTPVHWTPYTLVINGDTVNTVLAKDIDPSFQLIEVFSCPVDPLVCAIQRSHTP